jgi:uncharacterized repeat protein (TIGR02543 family)
LKENAFVRDGYAFNGWNTQADGNGTSYTNKQVISDLVESKTPLTLYATWRKKRDFEGTIDLTRQYSSADVLQLSGSMSGGYVGAAYFNPADLGSFYVYTPQDPRAAYLTDLGLAFPENISKLAESENTFAIQMSAENIDILKDVDMIVCYGNDDLIKAMQADSLLGTVDAIKNGAIAAIEDGSVLSASCTPSALSIPATIDEYLEIIGAAASNVK